MIEAIKSRRSVRKFTDEPVDRKLLMEVLEAGRWAPSGLNNQPWRFALITDKQVKAKVAPMTKYHGIVDSAQALIALFIDKDEMYHEVKDHQSIGACAENMLLAAHGLGLGAVWLGEILKSADELRALLELPENLELMCVIALGHPASRTHTSKRKPIEELIVKDI